MLSGRTDIFDKIHAFEIGVDDYVTKPFEPKELMFRIKAVLNRTQSTQKDIFQEGPLTVDFKARSVYLDGKKLDLPHKVYELFAYFVKNRENALTRDKLLNDIWGYNYMGDDRTLDSHIKILRQSLGEYGDSIVTLRGTGYRFDMPKSKR
jgi:DNA-binding response OmpR family regulator